MAYKKRYLWQFRGAVYENFKVRTFMWKKEVYEEWFYYAKLSNKPPKAFGDLDRYKRFADWYLYPNNACDLFCEPNFEAAVQIAKGKLKKGHIRVDIDLQADYLKLVDLFKQFIVLQNTAKEPTWQTSQAQFKPSSAPQNIKTRTLRDMRRVYMLHKKGLTRAEIAEKMKFVSTKAMQHRKEHYGVRYRTRKLNKAEIEFDDFVEAHYAAAMRKVSRYLQNIEKVFINIEKGTFP